MGSNFTCAVNCIHRKLQNDVPRNMVCFRHIVVNTLHEGDNKVTIIIIIIIIIQS